MAQPPKELIEESLAEIAAHIDCRERPSPDSHTVIEVIGDLGRYTVESVVGPAWSAEAARRSGVVLPIAARFSTFLSSAIVEEAPPESTGQWLTLMLAAISLVPPDELGMLLEKKAFNSTKLSGMWSEDSAEREAAFTALSSTLKLWIEGAPFSEIGGAVHGSDPIANPRRGQTHPLPRTIRLIDQGIGFGLTRAAGLLAAVIDVAIENGTMPAPDDESRQQLERLPVVLRFGAVDPLALALLRSGARPRAVAHLLAERLQPLDGEQRDDALRGWAANQLEGLGDEIDEILVDPDERQLIAQFLIAREAR